MCAVSSKPNEPHAKLDYLFFFILAISVLFAQLNSSVRPVPPPRDHLRIEQDGRLVNRAPAPQVPERNHPQHASAAADHPSIGQVMAPSSEQLDTIQKYKVSIERPQSHTL